MNASQANQMPANNNLGETGTACAPDFIAST